MIRPHVTPPRGPVPLPLLAGVLAMLALGLFLSLNARRQAAPPPAAPFALAPVPDLAIPPAPPRPAATQLVIHANPPPNAAPTPTPHIAPPPLAASPPVPFRLPDLTANPTPHPGPEPDHTPALVLDFTPGATKADPAADDTVQATLIRNRATVIAQGTVITAILETPLDSDRPGIARALVSGEVRGFDGTRILIPRGSRLIGSFKAEANPGLRRVPVTWDRLIRPDGVAIRLASPGTDALGGAGLPGTVNTHFAERLTSAVLQSALTIGVNVASDLATSGNGTYIALQGSQIGQQLTPNTARAPTIKVRGGSQIAILVAHDLDFTGTPAVR